jgi:predicted enzyme related to lactoylglutathione lyase
LALELIEYTFYNTVNLRPIHTGGFEMTNRNIVHIEFSSRDPKESGAFYQALFGWKIETDEQLNYTQWDPGIPPSGGFNPLGEQASAGDVPSMFSSDDIDADLQKATELACCWSWSCDQRIGWFGIFKDPTGSRSALYQRGRQGPIAQQSRPPRPASERTGRFAEWGVVQELFGRTRSIRRPRLAAVSVAASRACARPRRKLPEQAGGRSIAAPACPRLEIRAKSSKIQVEGPFIMNEAMPAAKPSFRTQLAWIPGFFFKPRSRFASNIAHGDGLWLVPMTVLSVTTSSTSSPVAG